MLTTSICKLCGDKVKFIPLNNDDIVKKDIETMKNKKKFRQFASKVHKHHKNL